MGIRRIASKLNLSNLHDSPVIATVRACLKLAVGIWPLALLVVSAAAADPPLKIGFGIGLTGPLSGNGKGGHWRYGDFTGSSDLGVVNSVSSAMGFRRVGGAR
jgi:hypothetical protein